MDQSLDDYIRANASRFTIKDCRCSKKRSRNRSTKRRFGNREKRKQELDSFDELKEYWNEDKKKRETTRGIKRRSIVKKQKVSAVRDLREKLNASRHKSAFDDRTMKYNRESNVPRSFDIIKRTSHFSEKRVSAADRESGTFRSERFCRGLSGCEPEKRFTVHVDNLHESITLTDIEELFNVIGPLLHADLKLPGSAEVSFSRHEEALCAVKLYHNRLLDGKPMSVTLGGTEHFRPVCTAVPQVEAVLASLFGSCTANYSPEQWFTVTVPKIN